ncbi:Dihydroorotate dehydrogenase (quinone), mitochondrial [Exophiala dermatitidis]
MRQTPIRLLLRASRPRIPAQSFVSQSRLTNITPRRHASTSDSPSTSTWGSRLLKVAYAATLVLGLGIVYVYVTDTRASAHRYIVVPALRLIYRDPEEAHRVGNQALKTLWDLGLYPRERGRGDEQGDLAVEVFGRTLKNPIATSAGIDKHADIPDALFAIGPAIVEIGGTTPLPQEGNPKPRVFRLPSQEAMINRYGLNSQGADHVASRLRTRVRKFAHSLGLGNDEVAEKAVLDGIAGVPPGSLTPGKLLAVNIAKNKVTPEDDVEAVTNDYVYCVEKLGPYADILVVNVSSPNTPGLRSLQQTDKLQTILNGVVKAAQNVDRRTKPAVMVKVSPDEDSDAQVAGICDAVWAAGVDGVIVGNTTNRRPNPLPHLGQWTPIEEQHLLEKGGFSGPHLFDRTVALVEKYKKLLVEPPPSVEPPQRRKGALDAETKKIKAELDSKSSDAPPTPAPEPDFVAASVETGAIPGMPTQNDSSSVDASLQATSAEPTAVPASGTVSALVDTGVIPPVNPTPNASASDKQPLIDPPQERFYDKSEAGHDGEDGNGKATKSPASQSTEEATSSVAAQEALTRLPSQAQQDATDKLEAETQTSYSDQPKVIFATGGITNGKQALEVLNAGASVAMVYTALVYGGAGTITRIKDEMRAEIRRQDNEKRQGNQK